MQQSPASLPTHPADEEIAALLKAAGIVVPPDLAAGVYSEARALRQVAHLVRSPRTAASEPSNIFSVTSYAVRETVL